MHHIDIDATPERIWQVLQDFASWPSWNSFIPMVEGELVKGAHLKIKVVAPGLKPMLFKPEVFEVQEKRKILWGGSFLGIVYQGDHSFLLEPLEEGLTRFRQIERFQGPIVLFMGNMIRCTEKGYHQMNQELKTYIEQNKRL